MANDLKTSLGIWAMGGMVTRFVPVGYQPEHGQETTAEKVRRAVEGLGDLIDDYEFHYPQELSADNLDEVRAALDGHGIYCVATGLHLDPIFGRGGLVSSIYSEDVAFTADLVLGVAPFHGRVFLGSAKIAEASPGPGTVLPMLVHGGPGRAGGGEELGGLRGLGLYMQRVALEGSRPVIERIAGSRS